MLNPQSEIVLCSWIVVVVQVYTLTQRSKELEADRDRVRLALERTEAAMIGYRERAHHQEQSTGTTSNSEEVGLTSDWLDLVFSSSGDG